MSIGVMDKVFKRYPNGGGEMLLALALADHADDDGNNIFPSVQKLAAKTRQSERTVQYQLRRMEDSGWLLRVGHGKGGRSQTTEYRISPLWLKGAEIAPIQKGAIDDEKGATDDTKGCNLEQERVQRVAPANNRHRTIKEPSVTVIGAGAQKREPNRATVLPDDFKPNDTAAAMAAELGVSLTAEQAAFTDHHTANGSTFKDWQAAFRTWLRNAARFARRDAGRSARRDTGETAYQRSMRELVQQAAPDIARRAPAGRQDASDYFRTVDAPARVVADVVTIGGAK